MKTKIDQLEGAEEETYLKPKQETEEEKEKMRQRKKKKVKVAKMCEIYLKEGTLLFLQPKFINLSGKCNNLEECIYAHNPMELDLVDNEKKIRNLQFTIQHENKKMENSKPPMAWKPTKGKDTLQSTFYL